MKRVIILGAGKSINEGIAKGLWNKIKGKEIWSLNSMFKVMPYLPTRELFVDVPFFRHTSEKIQQLAQKGVTLHAKKHNKYAFIPTINQYMCSKNPNDKVSLYIGGSGLCGLFALSLAVKENYEEIFILGYDWGGTSRDDKYTHCYQDKQKELEIWSTGVGRPEVYFMRDGRPNKDLKDFKYYLQFSNKIYNVSIPSHIEVFPKLRWEEFFDKIAQKDASDKASE